MWLKETAACLCLLGRLAMVLAGNLAEIPVGLGPSDHCNYFRPSNAWALDKELFLTRSSYSKRSVRDKPAGGQFAQIEFSRQFCKSK